jgi:hypothetical protein
MLSLVDLAGSERIKRSNTAGDRMAESIAINKSLSALGERPLAVAFSARRVRWCAHCARQAMCSSRSRRRRSTCRTATRSSHGSCSRVSRRRCMSRALHQRSGPDARSCHTTHTWHTT